MSKKKSSQSADVSPSEQARPWWVYVLLDARKIDDEWGGVRYVGKSVNTKARMSTHRTAAKEGGKTTRKDNWVRRLIRLGLLPIMRQIETGVGFSKEEVDALSSAAEVRWIAGFRALGCPLKNLTIGGEGTTGHVTSAETRAKQSARKLGTRQATEVVERQRAKLNTPEGRALMSERARKGKGSKKSEAWKEKNRKKRTGKALENLRAGVAKRVASGFKSPPASAETRAKLSAAGMGRARSAESIAKTVAANIGRVHSAETRAKLRASHIGKTNTPESNAKRSESLRRTWAQRKAAEQGPAA